MPQSQIDVEWVTTDIIRKIFNDSQIFERAQAGDLTADVKRDSHPDIPPAGEPHCTRSQIVYYYTRKDEPVAIAHQYLRPDGTIGASGRPDPKRIFLPGRIISIKHGQ